MKNKEIENVIANEFDSRMEAAVVSYILNIGTEGLKNITEDEIVKMEGNNFMTTGFVQALVRTAVKLCKTYSEMELMEFIRAGCRFTPFPIEMTLYKDDFKSAGWEKFCHTLDVEEGITNVKCLIILEEK